MTSAEQFAEWTGAFRREVAGMLRRMTIGHTIGGGIWQALGHLLLDVTKQETPDVEVYPGIGIFARPPDGNGELIVANIAGPNQKAAIAQRDEATRTLVNDIAADETTLYNAECRLYLKHDGTIEARTHAGVAIKLPTLADVAKIETAMNGATIVANDGGASLKATFKQGLASSLHGISGSTTWPVGTTKFKAE